MGCQAPWDLRLRWDDRNREAVNPGLLPVQGYRESMLHTKVERQGGAPAPVRCTGLDGEPCEGQAGSSQPQGPALQPGDGEGGQGRTSH